MTAYYSEYNISSKRAPSAPPHNLVNVYEAPSVSSHFNSISCFFGADFFLQSLFVHKVLPILHIYIARAWFSQPATLRDWIIKEGQNNHLRMITPSGSFTSPPTSLSHTTPLASLLGCSMLDSSPTNYRIIHCLDFIIIYTECTLAELGTPWHSVSSCKCH